jgi:hypothetical protein
MEEAFHTRTAKALMDRFALETGLEPVHDPPRRYLWTDAFAVCNFLELTQRTGEEGYRQLALRLVDQVHEVLGRHRTDDARTGWISGLDEDQGRLHPTRGGLRIGKKQGERMAREPFEEDLEWDRDGQYFHYLTRWMHALHCVSSVTGKGRFNRWAVELAKAAHARFVYTLPSGEKAMYWKMSIDLSYPLVPSMGHHDPLDGWITYHELWTGHLEDDTESLGLDREIQEMAAICRDRKWATGDPLGLGGLLVDAFRVAQLMVLGAFENAGLLERLLTDALLGLKYYAQNSSLTLPADHRLAFRELGLSIGLHAVDRLGDLIRERPDLFPRQERLESAVGSLMQYMPLCEAIEVFWLEPRAQASETWREHLDINTVMLATSLAPDRYLGVNHGSSVDSRRL